MIDLNEILTQLDFSASIDMGLVVLLMGVGYCIKHIPLLDKVSNNIIPIVLIVTALALEFLSMSYSGGNVAGALTKAITSAAVAIGFHQCGKPLFETIKDLIGK